MSSLGGILRETVISWLRGLQAGMEDGDAEVIDRFLACLSRDGRMVYLRPQLVALAVGLLMTQPERARPRYARILKICCIALDCEPPPADDGLWRWFATPPSEQLLVSRMLLEEGR